jgi:hypothetical protein
MHRLYQHFYRATLTCTGNQSVKTRLAQAWIEELDEIRPAQIPPSIRKEFDSLRDAMYAQQSLPTEHAAQASVRKMSVKQAEQYAGEIVFLFQQLVLMNEPGEQDSGRQKLIKHPDATIDQDDRSLLN